MSKIYFNRKCFQHHRWLSALICVLWQTCSVQLLPEVNYRLSYLPWDVLWNMSETSFLCVPEIHLHSSPIGSQHMELQEEKEPKTTTNATMESLYLPVSLWRKEIHFIFWWGIRERMRAQGWVREKADLCDLTSCCLTSFTQVRGGQCRIIYVMI